MAEIELIELRGWLHGAGWLPNDYMGGSSRLARGDLPRESSAPRFEFMVEKARWRLTDLQGELWELWN